MTIDFRKILELMNSMVTTESRKWKVVVTGDILTLTNFAFYIRFRLFRDAEPVRLGLVDCGRYDRLLLTDNAEDQLFYTAIACICELVKHCVSIEVDDTVNILQ